MNKLLKFYDTYALKALVCFLILFTALYPKLPSVHIIRTWVYIRLEDFFIFGTSFLWFIQLLRRQVSLPRPFATTIGIFWAVGLVSTIFSILFIGPHLTGFFSHLALLEYARRIEYMILFFIAFSTIKSYKDVKDYIVILCITILAVFLYGLGQRYYLVLWEKFPAFFQKYSFCFPSFQTGNEEFAKGLPLCLPQGARINSTFGGHYDLAAYLVLVLPILIGLFVSIKKWSWKIVTFGLYISGLFLMLFTASRTSFMAYLIGAVLTLIFYKKKWYILPVVLISIVLLLTSSQSTAKRLLATFRISSVVVNSQGQVIGEVLPDDLKNKISKVEGPPPAQDLQVGSAIIGLPNAVSVSTGSAMVKKTLSPEEIKRRKLAEGSIELSTVTGSFQVRKALVYDISFTTRFQAEWPNAWHAFLRNPLLGSGYSTITLASDNDYLRALGETGLLGLLSFVLIFIVFGITMKERIAAVSSPLTRGFIFGLAGGVIGLALNAILIDVFEASKVAENLWILLCIAVGGLYVTKSKNVEYMKTLTKVSVSNSALCFYLVLLVAVYYSGSIGSFFVADDFTWLRWAASSTISDIPGYFAGAQNFFYRPLDKTIIFFLYNFFAFRPENYHLFTLFLHAVAVLATYKLSFKLFQKKLPAFLTAFVFLALPIHGENIFWFSTISITLSAVFILAALSAFYNYRIRKTRRWYFYSFILSVFAFLSYEISVIVPLLLVSVDFFFFKQKKDKKLFFEYLPFFALIPVYFLVRMMTHAFSGGGDYSYSIPHLIPNVGGNLFGYFGMFFAGKEFLPIYDMLRGALRENMLLFGGVVLVVIGAVSFAVFSFRKQIKKCYQTAYGKLFVFGLTFGVISLMPFLALGNVADRYLYLASFGFSLSFIITLYSLVQFFVRKNPKKVAFFMVIFIVLLGIWYYSENGKEQKKWNTAGEITKTTIALFRTDYETIPSSSKLFFVNVPVKE